MQKFYLISSLQNQISNDRQQCERYLATECVRDFLSEQEAVILEFCDEFKQLSLADEKCDFLLNFYRKLYSIMNSSPSFQGVFKYYYKQINLHLTMFRLIHFLSVLYLLFRHISQQRKSD